MDESILDSIKKVLNLSPENHDFDADVIMHINSAFSDLHQLGVGPELGFEIENADAMWSSFFGDDPKLNWVKKYVYISVRLIFDPPTTSYMISALERQREELMWRLNVQREETQWAIPVVVVLEP